MKEMSQSSSWIGKFIIVILGILATVTLALCPPFLLVPPAENKGPYYTRITDEEAGVTCWVFSQGVSCLPTSQTDLRIPPASWRDE